MVKIIEKDSNQKTQKDIKMLQGALKNIKLFQELANEIPPQQMLKMYKELHHVTYPTRTIVFNQGEIGKEFYIILKGVVFIIGNEDKKEGQHDSKDKKEDNESDNQQQSQQDHLQQQQQEKSPQQLQQSQQLQRRRSSVYQRTSIHATSSPLMTQKSRPTLKQMQTLYVKKPQNNEIQPIQEELPSPLVNTANNKIKRNGSISSSFLFMQKQQVVEDTIEDYIKRTFPHFDILAKLESGSSFGEVALKDSVPRTATAICSGETHFVTLKRDAFKKFLERYYELVQQQNIFFIKEISIFKNWTDQMVNQMFFFFEKRTVRMNEIIYKENQEPDGIYLIKNGDIKLYQEFALAYNQEDKLKSIRRFMRTVESPKLGSFQAPISHLSTGQMFGSDEIVVPSHRKHSAVCCSSSSSLLFLSKEKFLLFSKRRNTFENAIEESAAKEKWHSLILGQLQTFQKGQNDYYKKKEREEIKASFSQQRQQILKGQNLLNNSFSLSQFSTPQNIKQVPEQQQQNQTEKILLDSDSPSIKNNIPQFSKTTDVISKFHKIINQQGACLTPSNSLRSLAETTKGLNQLVKSEKYIHFGQNMSLTQSPYPSNKLLKSKQQHDEGAEQDASFTQNLQKLEQQKGLLSKRTIDNYLVPFQKEIYQQQYQKSMNTSEQQNSLLDQLSYMNLPKMAKPILLRPNSPSAKAKDTIRNSSIDDGRVAKEMENNLHASLQMHKTFQGMSDAGYQQNIDAQCVHKLDLENQMIQVCEYNPSFKRRIENLYPSIVSYEGKQQPFKRQISAFSLDRKGVQSRILQALKLPRVLDTDSDQLLSIFRQKAVNNGNQTQKYQNKQNQTHQSINSLNSSKIFNNLNSNTNIELKENNSNNNSTFITTEDSNDGSKTLKNQKSQNQIKMKNTNKTNKPLAILSIEEMPGNHALLSPIEQIVDAQSLFGSLRSKKQVNKSITENFNFRKDNRKNLQLNNSVMLGQRKQTEGSYNTNKNARNRSLEATTIVSDTKKYQTNSLKEIDNIYLKNKNSNNHTSAAFQIFKLVAPSSGQQQDKQSQSQQQQL